MSSANEEPLVSRIREALRGPLPGDAAHRLALPEGFAPRLFLPDTKFRDAAVLVALYREAEVGRILFPLIRRPASLARHAGQISLPGGEQEDGEDVQTCALREAHEEIGIEPSLVEVLGHLSPVRIPVTHYDVVPVVGWLQSPPRFRLQETEVRGILLADPDALVERGPSGFVEHRREEAVIRFPAWDIEGAMVWGATAQILGELVEVWRGVRGAAS